MDLPAEQQQALDRAIQTHSSGKLDEAEKLYSSLLDEYPTQADALQYLGVINLQRRQFDAAVSLLQQAVLARPDYVDAIVNLGYGLNATGRFEAAVEQYEQALTIGPATAPLLSNLGGSLQQLGRYADAIERFEAALKLQPDLHESRRSLADALLKSGRVSDALREIRKATASGQLSLAMQVSLGNILSADGQTDAAIRSFKQVLRANPNAQDVRENLAKALRKAGKSEEAVEHYKKLLDQDPENADKHHKLGVVYQDLNKIDEALASFRQAVRLDPKCAKAWHSMSAFSGNAFDANDVDTILALQTDTDIAPESRMLLAFALGRYFEKSGQHDKAAAQFLSANKTTRAELDYDIDKDLSTFEILKSEFDAEFIKRWSITTPIEKSPIFIVGMHRSGSTLVEQILASHPNVFAAGELSLLTTTIAATFPATERSVYTRVLENSSTELFQAVAKNYVDGLPKVAAGFITDKMPHNFLNIGTIRILFPNARIVHCRRDPRDTCFSIFKNLFGTHPYTFDLAELAHYYNAYASLMDHWDATLPGQIHHVDYETMIDEQEKTTRALLDACGLEWDPACLDFHKHERAIATISVSQVRQPVYRGSIGAWKPYEKMLQPLLKILDNRPGY